MQRRIVRTIFAWLTISAVIAALNVCMPRPAGAHAMDNGYMDVRLESDAVTIDLTLDFVDLGKAVELPVDYMSSPPIADLKKALADRRDALGEYVGSGVRVFRDEMPCEPEVRETNVRVVDGQPLAWISLAYPCGGESTRIRYDLFIQDINRSHTNIAQITGSGYDQQFLFTIADRELLVGERSWLRQGWQFIRLGMEHIFTGYDHILFVLCLLPAAISLAGVAEVVTAFTLGHSITLGLATIGAVSLPGRLVESAIAASIIFVAAQNLLGKNPRHRWIVTLLFGLVHGFGFAGILQEMALPRGSLVSSLLFFNVGVELGQIAIVSLAFPLVVLLRRYRTYPRFVAVGSSAVIAIGLFWLVQRAAAL